MSKHWAVAGVLFATSFLRELTIPFLSSYYWSSQHSRFREGEERSFDILPEGSVPRLQRLQVSRRESVGQFVAARSHLPARGSLTIRSKFRKGVSDLPPPPGHRITGPLAIVDKPVCYILLLCYT